MLNIAVVLMDSIFLIRLGHLFRTAVCLHSRDERVFLQKPRPVFKRIGGLLY